eukprot:8277219-Pyramimonas_sp.AAC.1
MPTPAVFKAIRESAQLLTAAPRFAITSQMLESPELIGLPQLRRLEVEGRAAMFRCAQKSAMYHHFVERLEDARDDPRHRVAFEHRPMFKQSIFHQLYSNYNHICSLPNFHRRIPDVDRLDIQRLMSRFLR